MTCKHSEFFQIAPGMEYRLNSRPERSVTIRPETLNRMQDEHYIMLRAFLRWDGQRHKSFSTYSARLLLFNVWPKVSKPAPETLNAAGFFHLGRGSASYDYLRFRVDSSTFLLLFIHITNAYRSGRQDGLLPLLGMFTRLVTYG